MDNERVDGLLTVPDAARFLKIGASTLWAYIAAGEIATVKIGPRLRRIPRSTLDEYIASRVADSSER